MPSRCAFAPCRFAMRRGGPCRSAKADSLRYGASGVASTASAEFDTLPERAEIPKNVEEIATNVEEIGANSAEIAKSSVAIPKYGAAIVKYGAANTKNGAANTKNVAANTKNVAANTKNVAANAKYVVANVKYGAVRLRNAQKSPRTAKESPKAACPWPKKRWYACQRRRKSPPLTSLPMPQTAPPAPTAARSRARQPVAPTSSRLERPRWGTNPMGRHAQHQHGPGQRAQHRGIGTMEGKTLCKQHGAKPGGEDSQHLRSALNAP